MAGGAGPGSVSLMNNSTPAGGHPPQPTPQNRPLVRTYLQHIDAVPDMVFPLLCPAREGDWLEGWAEHCEILWSASGFAEAGCVFRTTEESRPDTTWLITEHDPDRHRITFARVTPGLTASTLRLEVGACGEGASSVAIRYDVVPTSPQGAEYTASRYDPTDLLASIVWWERSMNHYLQTGRLLRRSTNPTTTQEM
jgi:hypothetical protein